MFGCGLKCSALMAYGHSTGALYGFWIHAGRRKLRQEVRDLLKKEVTPELIAEVAEYSGGAGPVFGRKLMGKITDGLW